MTWFTELTGLEQETPDQIAAQLHMDGQALVSNANGRRFDVGQFALPQLAQLRDRPLPTGARTTVREVVADVQQLHCDPANAGAVFQVASQFNALEMVSPSISPEDGVGIYEHDKTQGPACAIACGAGTIWRNYYVPIGRHIGQSARRQLNGIADLGAALGNDLHQYWSVVNGYVLPNADGLQRLTEVLVDLEKPERDRLRGLLRVGLHSDVEVTLADSGHSVTQIYCSAMPVAYSFEAEQDWRAVACLVLEAAYEATLRAACENLVKTGNRKVFLTLLGGGAFGNAASWIENAALRALHLVKDSGLDISFVSYGGPNDTVARIMTKWDGMAD